MVEQFLDRRDAGSALGQVLLPRAVEAPVVLALPRGGVPVACEVARVLGAPVDVFIVQKISVPGCGELAMGALASGGIQLLDGDLIRRLRLPVEAVDAAVADAMRKLASQGEAYGVGFAPPLLRGRTVVLVDEGLAAGITMRAAVQATRKLGAARIVVAAPVGARKAITLLGREADEVVCLRIPDFLGAVGRWYRCFGPTSDCEVRELLGRAQMDDRLAS